ncbi:flagellar protein FliO/FliZ [Halanaerobium congolense]|uniref:Flagellar protein FliO/FliZ n=1 Tax=Halanaerobium congolense TaxID=54121 RepID=A0A1G6S4R2_9FIRM|nr:MULTISPECIES: flagellar biosynthetic protein FliO [Halanaerobium]OEG61768.1 MAG: hypothetical protein BHK79_07955 [Halanaerobium sp. MDAL1]TDP26338.1 flagellar protein FliO/FliZ [Halanaerobium congolense]TDS34720.1 flagellar protein FliO/FliZ [Halanaerobium congolense]TDX38587.1 flagellar protein FliO/FliZ [Halanaerobium congolense]SDD11838.1 flagellar protein FliO/FliZ [Halanaerobium congolense]
MNYMWETFKMAFYLILVIGFIFATYYFIKKRFNFSSTKELKLIDSLRLFNGETIYLVKVYNDIVMLGGSKEELNFLKSWPVSEIDFDLNELEENQAAKVDFKEKLKKIINQNKNSLKNKQNQNSDSDQDE